LLLCLFACIVSHNEGSWRENRPDPEMKRGFAATQIQSFR